jgi:hypothetical protein
MENPGKYVLLLCPIINLPFGGRVFSSLSGIIGDDVLNWERFEHLSN